MTRASEQALVSEQPEQLEPIVGALVGRIVECDVRGRVFVDHPRNPRSSGLLATPNVELGPEDVGAPVTLLFEEGDPLRPIIIARVWQRPSEPRPSKVAVKVDGERLEIKGDREIVLRCGKASITLTRAGKVLIRGTYILQTSSGANKIKGASVQIN
ncbi:MAG: DUF6484 domain-containing protein [Enhygromyxa sp.]